MTTFSGSYVTLASYNRGRAELTMVLTYPGGSLDAGDTTATLTWTLRVRKHPSDTSGSYASDTFDWAVSGAASSSGSKNFTLSGPNDLETVASGSVSVPLTYSTQSRSMSASVNPRVLAGVMSVSGTISIPARPILAPNAPTSVAVSRTSDTRQTISWAVTSTSQRPVTKHRITRSVNGGTWTTVANLTGTPRSWVDTSTGPGNVYRYNVVAGNDAGETVGTPIDVTISTTPHKPGAPSAAKNAAGDIVITRPALSASATSWSVGEYGGATLSPQIPASQSTWILENPDTNKTWRFVVLARSSTPTLTSAWSDPSNTVQLLTAPASPTNLSPNGALRDATNNVGLSYRHNSLDTTAQTARVWRHRLAGTTTWTEVPKATTTSQGMVLDANTYSNGDQVEWQVSTWGQATTGGRDGTGASPWSAVATITFSSTPIVGILEPSGGITEPSETVEWSFYQAEGRHQVAWQTEVTRDGVLVRSSSGTGTGTSWSTGPILTNGETYTFRVRVQDSMGQWSLWASTTQTVNYDPPNPPLVDGEWHEEGYVRLEITSGDDGSAPATVSFSIDRSINGGPWVRLITEMPLDSEYLDWTATANGSNTYRVSAVSALPSIAVTEHQVLTDQDCYLYIGGGPDYAVVARLKVLRQRRITSGRQRVLNHYAGQESPTETSGLGRAWAMSVSATMMPAQGCTTVRQSEVWELERLFDMPGPHLMRDGDGRYETVTLSDLDADVGYLGDVSFTMTRSTTPTAEQLAAISDHVGPVLVQVRPGEFQILGGTTFGENPGEWQWTP